MISDTLSQLQAAITEAQQANAALEKAKASLAPLEQAAIEKNEAVNALMRKYQEETGAPVTVPGRRKRGPNRKQRSPEENVHIQMKKAETVGKKKGLSGKKLKDFVDAAGKAAADKGGIAFPLKG